MFSTKLSSEAGTSLFFFCSPNMTSPLHGLPRAKFSTASGHQMLSAFFFFFFWAFSFQMSLAAQNNCSVTKGGASVRDRKHRAGSSFLPALLLLKLFMGFLQAAKSCCSSLLERVKFTFPGTQWWSWLKVGEFGFHFQLWLLKVE